MSRARRVTVGAALAFCLLFGELFSSNAIRAQHDGRGPGFAQAPTTWRQIASTTTIGWTPRMPLAPADAAAESASLAMLGLALIAAAGVWRRIVRRRRNEVARLAAARPAATALRLVPQPRRVS